MGEKHHYVPRFYLTAFASAFRRINLFNLRRQIAIKDVSLRDQCYARHLYGDNGVEQALATIESHAAAVIRGLISSRSVPRPGTADRAVLHMFVALQHVRTTGQRANLLAAN